MMSQIGHETAGELAFAVGESGVLPTSVATATIDATEMVWRWLLYSGSAKTDPKDAWVLADYAHRNADRLHMARCVR